MYSHAIEYLSDGEFEALANRICQEILGTGVISFSPGRDGGRDGKYHGKAEKFPSSTKPWDGKMIIQAKHTANPVAKCNSGEFFKNKESIINKEIEKIKKLKTEEGVEYYLMFTNRKYSGESDHPIIKKISDETGLPEENIMIIGIETINAYLKSNPEIVKEFQLNKNIIPFDFSDDEIKNIITEFKSQLPEITDGLKDKVEETKYDFNKTDIEEKNEKNNLSNEYYEEVILDRSLKDFEKIDYFLSDSKNEELKEQYFDIVDELNELIVINRENFAAFEEIFQFIYSEICNRSQSLLKKKRHIRTLLHFMYFECVIGKK
jgi:hypothetical protein